PGTLPSNWGAVAFDDSSFPLGEAPFASAGYCAVQATRKTDWPANSDIVLRRTLDLPAGTRNMRITAAVDNDVQVFVNGTDVSGGLVVHEGCADAQEPVFTVPDAV